MNRTGFAALAAATFLAATLGAGAASAAEQYVTLNTWYSASRGDHFATTQREWAARAGGRRADGGGSGYAFLRSEGRIFNPDLPQPPNTVPLYSFWNDARGDNFLTSQAAWTRQTSSDGYTRFRLEGYVFDTPRSGTLPLTSLWSAARADNYSTTDWRLLLEPGASAMSRTPSVAGGGYAAFRIEGYVLPPAAADSADEAYKAQLTDLGLGAWRPQRADERALPGDPLARAEARVSVPMIMVGLEWRDLAHTAADDVRYAKFASATDDMSLSRAVGSMTGGKLTMPATYIGRVRDPVTLAQVSLLHDGATGALARFDAGEGAKFESENGFALSVYDLDGDGPEADELHLRTRTLKLMKDAVDFAALDRNRDGAVDVRELVVLRFGADRGIGGQQSWSGAVAIDGKNVATSVLLVAADTTRAGLLHETLHSWGGIDIYGPNFAHNFGASLMAAMSGSDELFQLDPWHRMKFGWATPQLVPIGASARRAGGFAYVTATGHSAAARPHLFYDPARGLSEYFLVEFRTNQPACASTPLPANMCPAYTDAGTPGIGLAVWHVRTDTADALFNVARSSDTAGRYTWWPSDPPSALHSSLGVQGVGATIGTPAYLQPANGEVALRWIDGTDTGVRIAATGMATASTIADLAWRDAASPHAPRLDALGLLDFLTVEWPRAAAGTYFHVDGRFPRGGEAFAAVLVAGDGRRLAATVEAEAPSRMILGVPRATPAGRYQLVLGPRSAVTAWRAGELSNGLKLEVPPPAIAFDPRATLPRDALIARLRRDTAGSGVTLGAPGTSAALPAMKKPSSTPIEPGRYGVKGANVRLGPPLVRKPAKP